MVAYAWQRDKSNNFTVDKHFESIRLQAFPSPQRTIVTPWSNN